MKMLRWMTAIRQDRIRNECIREKVEVASIVEKQVQSHLWWFGYMRRRHVKTPGNSKLDGE